MSNHNESNRHDDHSHESQDTYQFTFDTTGTRVLTMTEVDDGRAKNKSLRGSTFEVERDAQGDVTGVTRFQNQRGVLKTEHYDDSDGDGAFVEVFSAEVLATSASVARADKARFTFDGQGDVMSMQELSKGRWKTERLDSNERLETITLDGADYVVKVELDDDGTEWSLYRDDNGDGVWTEVAEVESNTTDNLVELVGLSGLLALTDGVIG